MLFLTICTKRASSLVVLAAIFEQDCGVKKQPHGSTMQLRISVYLI